MDNNNTQLTSADGYDTSRMIFSEPQIGNIPDSKPQISFKRINIATRNEDGTQGELILPTEQLFSFGVGKNVNKDTGKTDGYSMPICLWSRDGPTAAERAWTDTFDNIVEKCKDYLIDNREEINQYDLERNDLKKLNPLYYKREKGKIVDGTGPTLYSKIIVSKKHNKIVTLFFDLENEPLNAMDLLDKYCFVRAAIKIESIFIGNKISLQVKLYECVVRPTVTGMKSLLTRPKARSAVLEQVATAKAVPPMDNTNNGSDDEINSLVGSEGEEEEEAEVAVAEAKPVANKPVRKVVKKVTRKPAE